MKKLYTLLLTTAIATGAIAQATYTANDVLNPTYNQMTLEQVDWQDVSSMEGPNMNWDFSNAGVPIATGTYTVTDPSMAEGNENFTGANQALVLTIEDEDISMYLSVTDAVEEVGYYAESGGFEQIKTYTVPKKYFDLPMSFGNSGSSSYAGTGMFTQDLEQTLNGVTIYEVVGFGSITLPNGLQYDNALMVSSSDTEEAVSVIQGMEFSFVTEVQAYDFFVPGFPAPVASFEEVTVTSIGGVEQGSSGMVMTGTTVGTTEQVAQDFAIYPNPAVDQVTIDLGAPQNANFEIRSMTGALVASQNLVGSKATLDLNELQSGVYFVVVQQGEAIRTRRLIVQ